jgi:hypothetical protein
VIGNAVRLSGQPQQPARPYVAKLAADVKDKVILTPPCMLHYM